MSSKSPIQSGSAGKNLTQVGRDYIKYISYNISAGNWGVVALNALVIAFVVLGLGTTAKAAHRTTINMMANDGLTSEGICTPEMAMLNLQIARQVEKLSQDGQLTASAISDLPELEVLRGPSGPAGLKGEDGRPGARGESGPRGEKGERGLRGEQGKSGPKGDTGPKGETGEKGDPGERGLQGESGVEGKAGLDGTRGLDGSPGVSAEEISNLSFAVKNNRIDLDEIIALIDEYNDESRVFEESERIE